MKAVLIIIIGVILIALVLSNALGNILQYISDRKNRLPKSDMRAATAHRKNETGTFIDKWNNKPRR